MSVFQTFENEESFWVEFTVFDEKKKCDRRMKWSEVVRHARKIRNRIDDEDAKSARAEYIGQEPDFDQLFSYRKGNKVIIYSTTQAIARRYREIKAIPRPWDEDS